MLFVYSYIPLFLFFIFDYSKFIYSPCFDSFLFQVEDGIRDGHVTGVQTCALPILRVVDMTVTKNWKGEVIDLQLTFGSEGITKRYQSNLNTAVDRINDIFDGRKKIKMSFLDERVQEISNIINGNVDSVFEYTPNGVIGWNGDDPNYMTRYVGDAIGFSRDGGKTYNTAMSADLGINADYITYGHAKGFTMEAVELYGSRFESRENDYTYKLIEGAYLESRGRYTNTWFGVTKEHDVAWKLNNGYLQAHTLNEEGMRLNYTGTGISTYIRGSNEDDDGYSGSGVLDFFSHVYHPDVRGVTLYSNRGIVGVMSATRDVMIDAARNSKVLSGRDGRDAYNYLGSTLGTRVTDINTNDDPDNIIFMPAQAEDFQVRSSKKSKINIRECTIKGLKEIAKIKVSEFDYVHGSQDRIGYISEENENIATDDKEFVSLSEISALHTLSLQELQSELNDLKKMIKEGE